MPERAKIDVVYTWVNCEDRAWQTEFNQTIAHSTAGSAQHPCRFRDYGELCFSLLSLEQFAPWINKIFIVKKAYQFPAIDALSSKTINKIIWIDEATLKPPELEFDEFYPTFNSLAIESNLHRIANLSEQFIYFNNDMFLGKAVSPDYFFFDDKARLSLKSQSRMEQLYERINQVFAKGHRRHIMNAYALFNQTIVSPNTFGIAAIHSPLHQCCPLLKSSFQFIWEQVGLKQVLLMNSRSKFRKDQNIHPVFLSCLINSWQGKAQIIKENDAFIRLQKLNLKKQLRNLSVKRPVRFCLNDHPGNRNVNKTMRIIGEFMRDYYLK